MTDCIRLNIWALCARIWSEIKAQFWVENESCTIILESEYSGWSTVTAKWRFAVCSIERNLCMDQWSVVQVDLNLDFNKCSIFSMLNNLVLQHTWRCSSFHSFQTVKKDPFRLLLYFSSNIWLACSEFCDSLHWCLYFVSHYMMKLTYVHRLDQALHLKTFLVSTCSPRPMDLPWMTSFHEAHIM